MPRISVQGVPADAYPTPAPEALRGIPREVVRVGDGILARPCGDVTAFGTPDLAALVDDLFATNLVAEGAAVAANQVGVPLRVFVWDMTDEWGVRHVGHLCNPVLDELPGPRRLVEEPEGCLSVPGPHRVVARPDRAVARGSDLRGRPLVVEGHGYFARCLQHETDHLHGRLYLDRLSRRERASALREMANAAAGVLARREESTRRLYGGRDAGTP